jgi:hypothetical protein
MKNGELLKRGARRKEAQEGLEAATEAGMISYTTLTLSIPFDHVFTIIGRALYTLPEHQPFVG